MRDVREAFDPETFRSEARALVDVLAAHLASANAREPSVLPWREPTEALPSWTSLLDDANTGHGNAVAILARVVRESNHLHHPCYVGHQVTSPLPASALADLVTSMLNNGQGIFEMGPAGVPIERATVLWLAKRLGLPPGADGVFTSGGSLGNLTALLAARQACAGQDAWTMGAHAGPPLAVLASVEAHYSVRRAVQVMGWGAEGAWPVPVDERFRMRPDALEEAQRAAERAGRKVIGVVASACSTATGAFDPLGPIADYCAPRKLWLHVDGAHGAAVALSPKYAHLVAGIERADSVVCDAHKLMLVPSLATAVLFRDRQRSYGAFAQEASYIFAAAAEDVAWKDPALRTLECTKRMMALPLFVTLASMGPCAIGAYIEEMIERARSFADMVRDAPDFELAIEPECNIVCFRWVTNTGAQSADIQTRLRERVVRSGKYYLVQTTLPMGTFLRVTIINPRTTDDDLLGLLQAVRDAAASR
jgi:L-2,4-diaminobutyrate decarboxylase